MSLFKRQFPYNQKQRHIHLSTLWECLAWPIGPPYKRGQPGPALHRDDAIGDPGDLGDAIGDWLRLSRLYSEPWTQSSLCKGDVNSGQGWPVFIQQPPELSQQQNNFFKFSLYEYIFRECVLKRWFSWAAMVWMTMTMVAVMIPELNLTRIGKVDIWAMWGVIWWCGGSEVAILLYTSPSLPDWAEAGQILCLLYWIKSYTTETKKQTATVECIGNATWICIFLVTVYF